MSDAARDLTTHQRRAFRVVLEVLMAQLREQEQRVEETKHMMISTIMKWRRP